MYGDVTGDCAFTLSDLDFMGGGYFYDLCRIHVANTITKDNWSVDHIKERFQISEGV